MVRFKTLAAAAAVFMLSVAGQAQARLQPTPAAWTPENVAAKTDAFVAAELQVYRDKSLPQERRKEALSLVLALRPDDPTAVKGMAFYLSVGAPENRYRELLDFAPANALANYYLAHSFSDDGYVGLAMPHYRAAVTARPNEDSILFYAGMNAFFAEDNAACIDYLTRALAPGSLPSDSAQQSRLKRGECYARTGDFDAAKKDFADSGASGAHYSIRLLADGAYRCRGGDADGRVRESVKLAANGKAYEAYREVTRALACDPRHVGALRQRLAIEKADSNLARHARVHEIQLQKLLDGGAAEARRAAVLQPPTAAAMLAEGKAIDMTRDPTGEKRMRAAYLAGRVLLMEPDNSEALLLRARALLNFGFGKLTPQAYMDATRALTLNPRLAVAHFVRAMVYIRGDGFKEAMVELNAAIAIDPSDLRFFAQRGFSQMKLGAYQPAIQDLGVWLAKNPGDLEMRTARALAYFGLKQYPAALADLDTAASANPGAFAPRAYAVRVLDAMGGKAEADRRHIVLLTEYEAAAAKDSYLAERATPALLATAAEGKGRKRAAATADAFLKKYDEAEDGFARLIERTENPLYPRDPAREISGLRSGRNLAQTQRDQAWQMGSSFVDSPDFRYLDEDRQLQIAGRLADLQKMGEMLARLQPVFDAPLPEAKPKEWSFDDDEPEWEY